MEICIVWFMFSVDLSVYSACCVLSSGVLQAIVAAASNVILSVLPPRVTYHKVLRHLTRLDATYRLFSRKSVAQRKRFPVRNCWFLATEQSAFGSFLGAQEMGVTQVVDLQTSHALFQAKICNSSQTFSNLSEIIECLRCQSAWLRCHNDLW